MKKILLTTFMMSMVTVLNAGHFYGTALCAYPQYECIKVTGDKVGKNYSLTLSKETLCKESIVLITTFGQAEKSLYQRI